MLTWERCRLTHRLVSDVAAAYRASRTAGVSLGEVGAPVGSVPSLDVPVDVPVDGVGLAVGVGVSDDVGVSDGVSEAEAVADGVVLGVGVCEAEPGAPEEGVVDGDEEAVAVGVGVLLADGVGEDDADAFSGWHCEITGLLLVALPSAGLITPLAAVAARLAGASAVQISIPVVVARTTPPAMRLSETGRTGRTRAKHMEDPARSLGCLFYLAGLPRLAQPLTLDDSPLLGGSDAIAEGCRTAVFRENSPDFALSWRYVIP
jgi:hypothetical protein